MANRAYSIEDGNTTRRTINQAIGRSYSDIDLTFQNKPSGDIYKKLEVAAENNPLLYEALHRLYLAQGKKAESEFALKKADKAFQGYLKENPINPKARIGWACWECMDCMRPTWPCMTAT